MFDKGSGNIIALDILRAKSSIPTLLGDIKKACGCSDIFDGFVSGLEKYIEVSDMNEERHARLLADQLALAVQGSILLRYGDPKVVC